MCAAHNNDLLAAGALDLRTAFISRPTEYGSVQKTDLEPEHNFDYAAKSIINLADQLGC